jgi:hypothetical protein
MKIPSFRESFERQNSLFFRKNSGVSQAKKSNGSNLSINKQRFNDSKLSSPEGIIKLNLMGLTRLEKQVSSELSSQNENVSPKNKEDIKSLKGSPTE